LDWDKFFLGNRPQEEIIDRLERKSRGQSDYKQIERGLSLIESLSKIQGPPNKVLEDARSVVKSIGFKEDPFKDLEESLELLNYHDLSNSTIIVDLGLTRDVTYYTGLIFEIRHRLLPKELSLAGGGRYDGLIRAMGGKTDTPAAGFAFALESLVSILKNNSNANTRTKATKTTMPAVFSKTPDSYENAIKLADSRRLNGDPAEVHFDGEASEIEKIISSDNLRKDIIVVDKYNNIKEYKVGK
jgi:histidyl-tRNA synthetase